jgi:hypothetical protein
MVHTSERDVHTFICNNKHLNKFLYKKRLFLLPNGNSHVLGSCGFGVVVVGVHGFCGGRGNIGGHIGG